MALVRVIDDTLPIFKCSELPIPRWVSNSKVQPWNANLTRVLIQFDIAKNIAEAIWSNGEKGDFGSRIKESVSSSSMAIMQAGCIG